MFNVFGFAVGVVGARANCTMESNTLRYRAVMNNNYFHKEMHYKIYII